MSNYGYFVTYDAKFKFSSLSNLSDMTSQRYSLHEENESSNLDIYPRNTDLTLKMNFYVQNRPPSDRVNMSNQLPCKVPSLFYIVAFH